MTYGVYCLNYPIGEEGEGLSGGQLKRIELARAILYNKPIILVDEGNASLDKKSAVAINRTLTNLPQLVIDVEHFIPAEALVNYTNKVYLKDQQLMSKEEVFDISYQNP